MKLLKIKENKKIIKLIEQISACLLMLVSFIIIIFSCVKINNVPKDISYIGSITLQRDLDYEDYDSSNTMCEVRYANDLDELYLNYSYDEYILLEDNEEIIAYKYQSKNNITLLFLNENVNDNDIKKEYKDRCINKYKDLLGCAISLIILSISILLIYWFSMFFTSYEKIWFISIMLLACIFSIIFKESDKNGISGLIIMLLYLLDTFLNILCELLISKQSKWNFIVSIAVEITEILVCIVLMYRFSTMLVTLLFWLPIDILSFINWNKHKDENNDDLTIVRSLKGYQEILIILGIILWTIIVGYFISGLNITTDLFNGNEIIANIVIYIDACASAVGIANGLFIYFRLKEQWIAWYICAFLEMLINIIAGQYILIILKIGYFTNTTYGYIKWSKYIKAKETKKIV